MTMFPAPDAITVARAIAEEGIRRDCRCMVAVSDPDNVHVDVCDWHRVYGLLEPTVTAHEVPW